MISESRTIDFMRPPELVGILHLFSTMRKTLLSALSLLLLLLFLGGCKGEDDSPTTPGRGSINVAVIPNPIEATRVQGTSGTYDLPFEVAITEFGGTQVTLTGIHVELKALGIRVLTKSYDRSYLEGRSYSPVIPANSTVRYAFSLREEIPDAAFSSAVEADIRAEGIDAKGNEVRQTKTVSLRRK